MGNRAVVRTSRKFPREIPEIPRSRQFVSSVLEDNGVAATDAILLVTSELMTNAVRHGAGEVEFRVELQGLVVRLEVLDDGRAQVEAPDATPSPTSLGGRGLLLVREVSKRWGSGRSADGRTCVWAELST